MNFIYEVSGLFQTSTWHFRESHIPPECSLNNDSCCVFRFFGIPKEVLPEIRSSSEVYGKVKDGVLKEIPISAVRLLFYSNEELSNMADYASNCR